MCVCVSVLSSDVVFGQPVRNQSAHVHSFGVPRMVLGYIVKFRIVFGWFWFVSFCIVYVFYDVMALLRKESIE